MTLDSSRRAPILGLGRSPLEEAFPDLWTRFLTPTEQLTISSLPPSLSVA